MIIIDITQEKNVVSQHVMDKLYMVIDQIIT